MMEYNGNTAADTAAPGISRPAPYGRACVNCARAKCKCILRSSGGSCERCFRLKKECNPSASVRKKRAAPRNSSQTARLERKLDGLVSLLKASSQGGNLTEENINDVSTIVNAAVSTPAGARKDTSPVPAITASNNITPSASTPSSSSKVSGINNTLGRLYETFTGDVHNCASSSNKQIANPLTPVSTSNTTSSSCPYILSPEIEPTSEEEKLWYDIFKEQFLDHTPFLKPILDDVSCSQLRRERPFLWLAIMSVSCPFVPKQTGLGQAVREVIAREVVIAGERRIDFLLGGLCFAHWAHYHFQMGPLLTLLSGVCTSLLLDLELDKPAPHEFNIKQPGRLLLPRFSHKIHIPETRTMEHRRIALTTWALSTNCAFFHHKSELLPWSPYMDDCLRILGEAKETYSDELLVWQIKLQQYLSDASMIYSRLRGSENEQTTRLIVPYIRSVKRQLATLKKEIPDHIAENQFIQITILYIEVAINEVALVRAQYATLMADKGLETMECLVECLHKIREWTDLFTKFHYKSYIGAPMALWKQLSLMMYTLVRLATLDDPAWDTDQVRRTVDLPALLDHVSTCLSHVGGLEPWKKHAENVHARSSRLMAALMTWTKSVFEGAMPGTSWCAAASAAAAATAPATAPTGTETATTTTASQAPGPTPLNQAQNLQQQQQHHNQLLMMNEGAPQTPSAAAFAAQQQQYQQGQMTPLPLDMFPYFNQVEPWADDMLGFWDIWSAGRPMNLE